MDVGETKAEHGGLHEAAIGAGLFAGPALAFTALHFWPQHAHAGIKAVAALLVLGFLWLSRVRFRRSSRVSG
jgi:hypothetical protein